jgi:hypothetical protein
MTQQERDELRSAEAKMTPGEWLAAVVGESYARLPDIFDMDGDASVPDARGIALLRNRIIPLLDHADEADAVIRRLIEHGPQPTCSPLALIYSSSQYEAAVADAEKLLGGKP